MAFASAFAFRRLRTRDQSAFSAASASGASAAIAGDATAPDRMHVSSTTILAFRPEGAVTNQPGATPRGPFAKTPRFSPERAKQLLVPNISFIPFNAVPPQQ